MSDRIIDTDKWQEIFATIRQNKLRTFLTALGVFWGIFMLVFLLGMGKGLENGVFRDIAGMATNTMSMGTWRTTKPYNGFPSGRYIRMNMTDMDALESEVPEISGLAPQTRIGTQPINFKDLQENFEVRGVSTNAPIVEANIVRQGRFINDADMRDGRKVAAIGDQVKKILFGDEDPVNKHITIRGVDFKVIGVFGPRQLKSWNQPEYIVVPITTLTRAFGTQDRVHWVTCLVDEQYKVVDVEEKIKDVIRRRHNIHPEDSEALYGWNMQQQVDQMSGLFLGIELFLWFVGIGTLIAGIVGVSNIMLIIVKERTKEIGVRKAMGATPRSIISLILTESVFITALSGYLGLALGSLIIGGINYIMYQFDIDAEMFYNPQVNMSVGIFAMVVLIISGIIAGLVPAMQASRVNPVIALKDE